MTEREQKIRTSVRRISENVAPAYSLLSLANARFLLDQLERARAERDALRDAR